MADLYNSYDYSLLKRDLSDVFLQLASESPTLMSLIRVGANATNTKHEWLEDSISPSASAIASFSTDGDGTGMVVASTAGFTAGDTLYFTGATGTLETERATVTSITNSTTMVIARDYGGSTGVTLVTGDIINKMGSPKNESTEASPTAGQEPTANYNYTQIFDATAKVSRTNQLIAHYGLGDALDYQVKNKMREMLYDINKSVIWGRRVIRSSSAAGTLGGILQYMESGNIDTTGSALSSTIINNMLEAIYTDGGSGGDLAIVCNSNQSRKLSAFMTAANQPVIQKPDQSDQTFGYSISKFYGDLPVQQGFMANVIVDPTMPKDQLAILNLADLEMNFVSPFSDVDATPAGADYFARRVLGEMTLTMKNGTKTHALATGLTV